ncbi:hypothetical protein [Parashewanella tropica]|uniref:hypothetical protein n=1 Tax=Parashewanella tropica TaxID=2547970 RepID=UPI00105AADE2|nr:hypothetical protein [Parashewanella tropica]
MSAQAAAIQSHSTTHAHTDTNLESRYEERTLWLNGQSYAQEEKHNLHRQILVAFNKKVAENNLESLTSAARKKHTHGVTDSVDLTTLGHGAAVGVFIASAPYSVRKAFAIKEEPSKDEVKWFVILGAAAGLLTVAVEGGYDFFMRTPEQRAREAYNSALRELEPHLHSKARFTNEVKDLERELTGLLFRQKLPEVDVWNQQDRETSLKHYLGLCNKNRHFRDFIIAYNALSEVSIKLDNTKHELAQLQSQLEVQKRAKSQLSTELKRLQTAKKEAEEENKQEKQPSFNLTQQVKPIPDANTRLAHRLQITDAGQRERQLQRELTPLTDQIQKLEQQIASKKIALGHLESLREQKLKNTQQARSEISETHNDDYCRQLEPYLILANICDIFKGYEDTGYQVHLRPVLDAGVTDWLLNTKPDIPEQQSTADEAKVESYINRLPSLVERTISTTPSTPVPPPVSPLASVFPVEPLTEAADTKMKTTTESTEQQNDQLNSVEDPAIEKESDDEDTENA